MFQFYTFEKHTRTNTLYKSVENFVSYAIILTKFGFNRKKNTIWFVNR